MSALARGALAAALLAAALLAAGGAYALRLRREEAAKARATQEKLEALASLLAHGDLGETTVDIPPPRARGDAPDPTGMLAVQEYLMGGHYLLVSEPGTAGSDFLKGELANDAWGRPILYRSPGRRAAWELRSLGANGVDDGGDGDDLTAGPLGAGPLSASPR